MTPAEYEARIERLREALAKTKAALDHPPNATHQEMARRNVEAWKVCFDALKSESPSAALEADRLAVGMRVAERVERATLDAYHADRLPLDRLALVRSVLKEGKQVDESHCRRPRCPVTCLDHDEPKLLDGNGYPYCVTCRRIAQAVCDEREACAKLIEAGLSAPPRDGWSYVMEYAAAIRARGGK